MVENEKIFDDTEDASSETSAETSDVFADAPADTSEGNSESEPGAENTASESADSEEGSELVLEGDAESAEKPAEAAAEPAEKEPELDVPADVVVPADDREIEAQNASERRSEPAGARSQSRDERVIEDDAMGFKSDDLARIDKNALSPEEKMEQSYAQLSRFMRTHSIVWGEVDGVIPAGSKSTILSRFNEPIVSVLYNGISIMVRTLDFFEPTYDFGNDYSELTDDEKRERRTAYARYYIGARVPLRMTAISRAVDNENNPVILAIGNRVEAMAEIRDRYFIHAHEHRGGNVNVKEGALVKANVLTVRPDMAVVECLGVETRISNRHLSNEIVENCRDFTHSGDTLTVRIRRLYVNEPEKEGGEKTVYLNVTGQIYATPSAMSFMAEGSTYKGTVISFNREKNVYTVLLKNQVHASVPQRAVPGQVHLNIGDTVSVMITKVYDNFVTGTAIKI